MNTEIQIDIHSNEDRFKEVHQHQRYLALALGEKDKIIL
jgi:hypothetical protein